ncbi:MAG: PHA/PHB synthase family protein, partial [Sphingopyxis sp.]
MSDTGSDKGGDETAEAANPFIPSPEDMQHWMSVLARAQQMMLEYALGQANDGNSAAAGLFDPTSWLKNPTTQAWAEQSAKMWEQGAAFWTSLATLQPFAPAAADAPKDKRFADPDWNANPVFALIRQTYGLLSEQLLTTTRQMTGLDEHARAKMEFAAKTMADALSPSNLAITNPEVIKRAVETRGESLLKGLKHMLTDLSRGQLSHVDPDAFEVGVNIATTPGKVIHETDLYQLIQYEPTTKNVFSVPLVIFPPWINRFYILDLNPAKSFVAWAVDQGLTVFMVSWKSADASMSEVVWDDYIAAQVDAIDTARELLNVPAVHTIGYCVAGTTLAATLAMLAARGEADKVKSVTFFTAQVDFELAGDLKMFVDDSYLGLLQQLS